MNNKLCDYISTSLIPRVILLWSMTLWLLSGAQAQADPASPRQPQAKEKPTTRRPASRPATRTAIRIPANLPPSAHTGYRLTELLLRHLTSQEYGKALQMMNDTIQKVLTPQHLRRQNRMVTSVIGKYHWNTLQLHSRVTHHGQTRYIWKGQFAKERGTILVLLDAQHKISGFVIQSPSLLRKLHQEQAVPNMSTATRERLNRSVDTLLRGYNQGKWEVFCQPCSRVMKQLLAPPRFQVLRKQLIQRYGRYVSRRLYEVRRLASLPNALIVRYHSQFSKQKKVRLQIVFQKKNNSYVIASWQLR